MNRKAIRIYAKKNFERSIGTDCAIPRSSETLVSHVQAFKYEVLLSDGRGEMLSEIDSGKAAKK